MQQWNLALPLETMQVRQCWTCTQVHVVCTCRTQGLEQLHSLSPSHSAAYLFRRNWQFMWCMRGGIDGSVQELKHWLASHCLGIVLNKGSRNNNRVHDHQWYTMSQLSLMNIRNIPLLVYHDH
eukprot:jgi/Botrbrau1/14105/Bobra.182_3s0048.1